MLSVQVIPNLLTYLRLLLIPIFVYLLIDPTTWMIYLAIGIFVFASFTDYLDGYLARTFNAVSDTGKLLDPVADKILVMAALVMLVSLKTTEVGEPWVPAWMVILILAREIWITGLRSVAASRGLVIAAGSAGKWKSFLQMIAIVFLLLHQQPLFEVGDSVVAARFIGEALLMFSILFSYWGGMEYTWQVFVENPDHAPADSADDTSSEAID